MADRGRGRPPKRKPAAYYDDAEALEEDWEDDGEPGNEDEEVMEILKMEQVYTSFEIYRVHRLSNYISIGGNGG